jgi:hypothetical protein
VEFDPDQIPLSTSEGRRPSSTAGDRMMVGLAALALMGGVLIAVSRLIPEQPDQTSQASATPVQSAEDRASPSPRPSPSPRQGRTMTVDPAGVPTFTEPSSFANEWVRMRTQVTLLSSPSTTARASGRLQRGEAAHLYDAPPEEGGVEGWLRVETPISGWILGELDNEAMFQRFPYRWRTGSGVFGLASSAAGFTATGWSTDDNAQVMLASSDGIHWQASETPRVTWGRTIADGPSGLLMAGNVENQDGGSATVLWQSGDARSWELLGTLPQEMTESVLSLAGSDAGYVLLAQTGSGQAGVWFSADGTLWTERPQTSELGTDLGVRLTATPLGFVVWGFSAPSVGGDAAFSSDGWTWSEADPIGPGQIVDVVADGDHLLALGRGPGGTHMWKGTIAGQTLTWSSDNTAPFREAVARRLVTDGERVIALGWDQESEAPLWWHRDGLSWQRHAMPADFHGLPSEAVGGPLGVVVVDQQATTGAQQVVIWHLGDGVRWDREPSPVMPAPAPPTAETCGPMPDDVLALMSIDGLLAADCFGDAPITVRGWTTECEGCYPQGEGKWVTEWLGRPADDRVIHLAPIESTDWGSLDGVLHPSLNRGMPPPSRWLEVTGHFDDPDAASCRFTPTVNDVAWYTGTADVVAGCRARFVVTAIRPVKRP